MKTITIQARRIALSVAMAIWSLPWSISANTDTLLQVIPKIREVKVDGSDFDPKKAEVIIVSDLAADRFAARLLQEAMRETHGVDCRIIPLSGNDTNAHRLWLGLTRGSDDLEVNQCDEEGYVLTVSSLGVAIAAKDSAGLFYGVQTTIQLVEQSQRENSMVPGMRAVDYPTHRWRGRYFDGSQYKGTIVPTRANLEREIKLMARYKLNCLTFDTYNLVPFKSFPYCADENTLSLADWQYLVEMAHRYHVTLLPSLQSFAQIYEIIWTCEEGTRYREETAPGIICPSRPESIQFLKDLYKDLISIFHYSPALGVGCSEIGMQWKERYCAHCRERIDNGETLHDIYYKHVRSCVEAVVAAGKEVGRPIRPLIWADEFYCGYDNKRWVGIENIPTYTLMGHWQYWGRYQNLTTSNARDYDGIAGLLERGFDVFFVSASFEFNTYLHDLSPKDPSDGKWSVLFDSGIYNVAEQSRWADVYNQKGFQGKVWGGVCATFSQHDIRCWDTTWFAYVLQAEFSWGDTARPLEGHLDRFTDDFAATFYRTSDSETTRTIASAYRELDAAKSLIEANNYLIRDIIGEYDIHDTSYNGNSLEASIKLLADVAEKPAGPGKTIEDIQWRCKEVLRVSRSYQNRLAEVSSKVRNTTSLHYLISAAHKMENHAQRTLFLLDLSNALTLIDSIGGSGGADWREQSQLTIARLQERCEQLRADTRIIADQMSELAQGTVGQLIWEGGGTEALKVSATSDTTGYGKVLVSLDAFAQQLGVIKNKLQNP